MRVREGKKQYRTRERGWQKGRQNEETESERVGFKLIKKEPTRQREGKGEKKRTNNRPRACETDQR